MDLHEIFINEDGHYYLKNNCINIIYASSGKLFFPDTTQLSQFKLLFIEEGSYLLHSKIYDIKLCDYSSRYMGIDPGQGGCDTQPSFIYVPSKQAWFVLSWGNFIIYTEREGNNWKQS